MKSFTPLLSASLLSFVILATVPGAALAQRAGTLPASVKTAVDAKPYAEEIRKFVASQIAALNGKDINLQQRARDALVKEAGVTSQPSPSFLDTYAAVINEQFLPLADPKKTPSVRTRLNAAIALQRIARSTNSGKLADSAAAFAADPSVGVVLWAVKAGQSIVPALGSAGTPNPKLTGAIVNAAIKNPEMGDLIEEAYKALTIDFRLVNEKSAPVVTADMLKLFQARVASYEKTTPVRHELERRPVNSLTLATLWSTKEGTKHRAAIMQQVSNLIGVVAQHAAGRPDTERKDFVDTLKNLGDSLTAIGNRADMKSAELVAAGDALSKVQNGMAESEFTTRATAAFTAIKAKFPETKPAPTISPDAVKPVEPELVEDAESGSEAAPAAGNGTGAAPAKDGAAPVADRPRVR